VLKAKADAVLTSANIATMSNSLILFVLLFMLDPFFLETQLPARRSAFKPRRRLRTVDEWNRFSIERRGKINRLPSPLKLRLE
jgi:hypothetical protein